MKRKFLILIIVEILIVLSTTIAIADVLPEKEEIQLQQGENEVLTSINLSPIYVKDLVNAFPEIMMITYFDETIGEQSKEIGYVNIFGGVGENFIIYSNSTYFITVERDLEVKLK